MDDLRMTISRLELAVPAVPDDHPDRAKMLSNLGVMLSYQYNQTENLHDLETAISRMGQAVSLIPPDHPKRAVMSSILGNMLSVRYTRTGNMDDLEAAILRVERAVSTIPQNYPDRAPMLRTLGNMLFIRYRRTGNMDDLEAAILRAEQAVSITPKDPAEGLISLGNMLSYRYNRTGRMEDLEAAISNAELAVSTTSENHPDRARWLSNLGTKLLDRYNRIGDVHDLEDAILKAELAVSTTPDDHPYRAGLLFALGVMLSDRYSKTGNMHHLEEAISRAELAVSTTPEDHSDRASRINGLGMMLSDRYKRTGNINDLEKAISGAELAISTTSEDHPDRAAWLNNLGNYLLDRYNRMENMRDLEAATSRLELAVSIIPEDHPNLAVISSNLRNKLLIRYKRTGNMEDLEAAILRAELAVSTTPENHPDRAGWLSSLGVMLSYRYNQTRNIDDLEAAISRAQLAVSATPEDHPDRAGLLSNLGAALSYRYDRTGNMHDLEAAISKSELALSAFPEDSPARAAMLDNLGAMLSDRYSRTRNLDDLQAALQSYVSAFDLSNAIPLGRMKAARRAIRILISMEKWDQACSLAQGAIELLSLVCGRYLSRDDQQFAILQISGLAADACSLSLKVGHVHQALQQLEFGRGIILSYLIDGRSDLAKLQNDYPSFADKYEQLRFKAFTDIEAKEPAIWEQLVKERRDASSRLEDCLHQIRQKSGYERFLLEATVNELKECANEGPIVIVNATDIGCDAIIVSTAEVQAIALSEMNSPEAPPFFQQKLGRYRTIDDERLKKYERDIEDDMSGRDYVQPDAKTGFEDMSWLWSRCVKPILSEVLKCQLPYSQELLRVWWIGTGIASYFPFHAAGQYDMNFGNYQDSENTLSQIIPSYTPTVKALSYARSRVSKTAETSSNETSILVVTMPATPDHRPLPGVDHERLAIQQITKDICRMKTLESPTAAQVLNDISCFDIVHFACHGSADPKDPSNSHLLLQTSGPSGPVVDELTVTDIFKKRTIGRTWIAYLSTCSTAGVEAKLLADESLHLASAFQVAGFAHVIGSLWPADDDICVRLAESFYRSLTRSGTKRSNRAVAEALRNAILEIRSETPDHRLWATFIHLGA